MPGQGTQGRTRQTRNFELYHLGWFGDGDAHFEILPKPQQIAVGSDYA